MIVVTGGAGFVGSNLVRALNDRGHTDIVVVEDLQRLASGSNLTRCRFVDCVDKDEFLGWIHAGDAVLETVEAVLHQGACTDTTCPDSAYVMANNHGYSRHLFDYCAAAGTPLVYASSAAVYGSGPKFSEHPDNELPLNVYGRSKAAFDAHVRQNLDGATAQVVGLRYFNVYGPGESHKASMASMVTRLDEQLRGRGSGELFGASHGLGPGRQTRDFVHVDDVVAVVLWFLDHPDLSGIYNCGTGCARTFADVAEVILDHHASLGLERGEISYVDFPSELEAVYQHHTRADLGALRAAGYESEFLPIEVGIPRCLSNSCRESS